MDGGKVQQVTRLMARRRRLVKVNEWNPGENATPVKQDFPALSAGKMRPSPERAETRGRYFGQYSAIFSRMKSTLRAS